MTPAPVVLERPSAPAISDTIRFEARLHRTDHTLAALRMLIEDTLNGPIIGDETREAFARRKAADLTTVIATRFGGDCRNCGATPLRELADVTESLELERT
jgi:hypothetical protein